MVVLTAPAQAADPPTWVPGPVQAANPTIRDLELTLRARRALQQDPALARLNLGVSVRDGIVTLWGTVPSAATEEHARGQLHEVLGLVGVHSQLRLGFEVDPGVRGLALAPLRQRVPLAEPILAQAPRVQGALVHRPNENGWAPAPALAWRAQNAPPIVSDEGKKQPANQLIQRIDAIRLSDERFHRVRCEVAGGVVYLRGTVNRWDHIVELARSITRLPGVEQVILDEVRSE